MGRYISNFYSDLEWGPLMSIKIFRLAAPFCLLLAAGSTGTVVLASEGCRVSLVQTLTAATHSAQRHTTPAHKRTKATLAAWEAWGNAYLAKHGHAYVPPKRKVATTHPLSPQVKDALFKFACEALQMPTIDLPVDFQLTPDDAPPVLPIYPMYTAESDMPPAPYTPPGAITPHNGGGLGGSPPTIPYTPPFFPPLGGGGGIPPPSTPPETLPGSPSGPGTPPVPPIIPTGPPVGPPITSPVPPVLPTPEPSSFLLLGTGITALWAVRKNTKLARKS
jgi:hypothetical protein